MALPRVGIAVVRGDSMVPTLHSGDRLLVRYGAVPRPDRLVIVQLPDRPVAVKRVRRRLPGGWDVRSDNPGLGTDSRTLGALPDESVIAVVLCRWWPPRRRDT